MSAAEKTPYDFEELVIDLSLIDDAAERERRAVEAWESAGRAFGICALAAAIEARRQRTSEKQAVDEADAVLASRIEEINKEYFLSSEGGKTLVFREMIDHRLNHRRFLQPSKVEDFKALFEQTRVKVSNGKNLLEMGLGRAWHQHKAGRNFLGGVIFDPANKHASNQYNTWWGFGVEERQGSWDKLQAHIRDVVCGGNQTYFEYLLNWMAYAVQHPDKPGQVVVVMKGKQGTGKGIVANAMLRLFGEHGMAVTNPQHLVGNFNSHLENCVLLFADEALFAGDRKHMGVLKSLVTEDTLPVEKKFQDVRTCPNFLHIMMASNNEWVVPAELDARRFFVLEVKDDRKGDFAYFRAIADELKNGGHAAMLFDLKRRNLADFNISKFPITAALQNQKVLTMRAEYQWLYSVLSQGFIRNSDYGVLLLEQWHENVTTTFLYDAYERWARSRHSRDILNPEAFGRFLRGFGYEQNKRSGQLYGEIYMKGDAPKLLFTKSGEKHGYYLGPLAKARAAFLSANNLTELRWLDEETGAADEPCAADEAAENEPAVPPKPSFEFDEAM